MYRIRNTSMTLLPLVMGTENRDQRTVGRRLDVNWVRLTAKFKSGVVEEGNIENMQVTGS